VPKTRVAAKNEVVGRTAEDLARASARDGGLPVGRSAAGSKSKVVVFAGVGGLIAAAVIAVMVMKGMGKTGGQATNSTPPAVTSPVETTTKTSPIAPTGSQAGTPTPPTQLNKALNAPQQSDAADKELYSIKSKLDELDDKDTVGFRTGLRRVNGLGLRTAGDTAYAEVVRAQALLGLGEKDKACAKLLTASTSSALNDTKQGLAKSLHTAYCSLPE
jgi:hypothetical protein